MPRLFSGIEIPEDIREDLARLRQPLPGAWWIEPENLHITLRFAGDIDNRTAGELVDQLALIDADVFELTLFGLGQFGGSEPRTLWVGIMPSPQLEALARAHERAFRAAGLPPERRNFKPHVTLARLKHTQPERLARLLERRGGYQSRPFLVERFALFSSRPQTGGGPYVVEEAYSLRGSPGAYAAEDWLG